MNYSKSQCIVIQKENRWADGGRDCIYWGRRAGDTIDGQLLLRIYCDLLGSPRIAQKTNMQLEPREPFRQGVWTANIVKWKNISRGNP